MVEINTVILEDGIRYATLKDIEINGNTYLYLTNVEDPEDFCFRKVVTDGEKKFLVGLEDEDEFELVLLSFTKELEKINK